MVSPSKTITRHSLAMTHYDMSVSKNGAVHTHFQIPHIKGATFTQDAVSQRLKELATHVVVFSSPLWL
jgi:hypothetical protein